MRSNIAINLHLAPNQLYSLLTHSNTRCKHWTKVVLGYFSKKLITYIQSPSGGYGNYKYACLNSGRIQRARSVNHPTRATIYRKEVEKTTERLWTYASHDEINNSTRLPRHLLHLRESMAKLGYPALPAQCASIPYGLRPEPSVEWAVASC